MIKTLKSTISILILTSIFSFQIQAKNYNVSILSGNNSNNGLSETTAKKTIQSVVPLTDWSKIANFNTNALTVGGPAKESSLPHHVLVRNCVIHDFPGGGLNAIQADYVIFEKNLVYNNAWYMMYAGSGISIFNLNGALLKSFYTSEQLITLQTSRFESGIYLVQVADVSSMECEKIEINN